MVTNAKLFLILTIGFRGDVLSFLYMHLKGNWHHIWRPRFSTNQVRLCFIVEGHLVTNSNKWFSILTIGFRGEDV